MMDTTNMTESELTDYYDRTGDRSEFQGGEVVKIEPGPKDSIVSVRFAAGELEAVERQAEEAGMKLTAFIRASALSGAQVVDLDRLRKVAAKLVADTQEIGKVVDLPTGRRTPTTSRSTGRTAAKSARTGRFQKSSRSAAAASETAASKATTKTAASKSTARPKSPPKGEA